MAFQSDSTAVRKASHAVAVTPSDTDNLANDADKGLYIGGTGAVHVTTSNGDDVTFAAVPVGILPVGVRRVHATGTTATNIIALR